MIRRVEFLTRAGKGAHVEPSRERRLRCTDDREALRKASYVCLRLLAVATSKSRRPR